LTQREMKRLRDMAVSMKTAADKHGVDPNIVAGIISRESNAGLCLDSSGHGDKGNAFGVMQVDKRHHLVDASVGPQSYEHIEQGVKILAQCMKDVASKHPSWPKGKQIQGGIAAYNMGVKNVQTQESIDRGSTGNNYSADVLERAEQIKNGMLFD